jgi:prepilin-type N-terminal cleavage/methylation domain-containing protein
MRLSHKHRGRTAFTLIELLVVIAIIAILVALTSAAVMRVLAKGPEVTAANDINQLASALGAFKAKFGSYPPSRIILRKQGNAYNAAGTQLDLDSKAYLQSMFSGLANIWATGGSVNGWGPNDGVTLTGDQCLVFFLGGIQTTSGGVNGTLGWGTGNDPTIVTGSTIPPFYQFQSSRLVPVTGNGGGYFTYLDAWKQKPYAYFSSYSWKGPNQYLRYFNNPGGSDCSTLNILPYQFPPAGNVVRFVNPDSFQIICAGQDGVFGGGGPWNPQSGIPGAGADDLTNFASGRVGNPQ